MYWVVACGLFMFFFFPVDSQNPIVKITEPKLPYGLNTLTAQSGSIVDFVCVVWNLPSNRKVQWQRVGSNGTRVISTDVQPTDTMYSIIKPNAISWKLRIKNVQLSMSGPYFCLVQHSAYSEVKAVIWLDVINKPRINNLMTSTDSTVIENEPLTLTCGADGIPPPVIKWTRLAYADLPGGGKEKRKDTLEIKSVKPEHRGKYICQADNQGGQARRIINVKVKFRPIVSSTYDQVFQAPGYAKQLTCDIIAYPPPLAEQIVWSKVGDGVALDDNFLKRTSIGALDRVTARLYIRNVRQQDYGTYRCSATNSMTKNRGAGYKDITLTRSEDPYKEPFIYLYASSTHIIGSIIINLITFLIALCLLS